MSTKNQQHQINHCWTDDRLSLRRRPHSAENGRIHRNRKANIGPDILEMKVDKFNINFAGEGEITPPLSMNRKKRWELLKAEEMPQRPERGIRVTKVIQRVNHLGKCQMERRDIFEEENVVEMCSKGGNGYLIEKKSGTGRGMNKLGQLFLKNDQPKKRRNLRKGRGLEKEQMEIDEGKPIWIDLFGEGEGRKKKTKKSGRNRAEEKEETIERMHFYYTIKCQMATKHQLDSGWQKREEQMTIQEKKFMKRSILGRKCQLKMGREYFDKFENSNSENNEEEFEVYRPKIMQKVNKRINHEIISENVEFAKKRPKNWLLKQIGQNEEKIGEKEDELKEMDWKLDEQQIEQLNGLEISKMNLPNGIAIYEWDKLKGIFKDGIEGQFPDGSLIIRRNGQQMGIKWFANLTQNEKNELEEGTSTDNSPKKRHILDLSIQFKMDRKMNQKIRKYLSQLDCASTSHQKQSINANENSAEFFRELLRSRDKKHRLDMKLLENAAFTEGEAALKALTLLFDEHKKTFRKWHKGGNAIGDLAIGNSTFKTEESNSDPENCPNFCEVCFAECNDLNEGFGLPECKEGTILGDEHLFCNGCWRKHIKQCLTDGKVPIGCMEPRCPSILHPNCALLVVGQCHVEMYRHLLTVRRQMQNDFLHCPKCAQLHFVKEMDNASFSNQLTICSNCAETICVKCGRRQHLPLSCMERDLYEHILRANGQSLGQLVPEEWSNVATGVRCTKYRNLVEKNQGCDHMTCRYGNQFCWRCGHDWFNHRQCQWKGQITIPLFNNHIFLNQKTGLRFRRMPRHIQVLVKFPEKFFTEYAKIRAPRERNGVELFLEMEKAFAGDVKKAGKWTVKYMQVSEFVELALVKSKLATQNDQLKKAGERLLLNFTSLLIMANLMIGEGERERNDRMEISREIIENGYTEMLALYRQMIK